MKIKFTFFILLLFKSSYMLSQIQYRIADDIRYRNRINGVTYRSTDNSTIPYNSINLNKSNPYVKDYDSISDVTTIEDRNNKKFIIAGKWSDFDHTKFSTEVFISHCPLLINSNNILLEIWSRYEDKFKWRKKTSNEVLQQVKKDFEENWTGFSIKSIYKSDEEKGYYLYKIKKQSRNLEDTYIEGYYLIGVKNEKVYRLSLFNFNESEFAGIDNFIINLYNSN